MDNRYFSYGCPAIWSDSRNLTNYYPHRTFNQFIRNTNNIQSAQEYRHFLQNNAETIMKNEMTHSINNNTCKVNGDCKPITGVEAFTNNTCGCNKN